MGRPTIDGHISLGNILTLIGMVATAVFLYGQTAAQIDQVRSDVKRIESEAATQRDRVRALENTGARQDATLELILQTLTEIKARLEQLSASR